MRMNRTWASFASAGKLAPLSPAAAKPSSAMGVRLWHTAEGLLPGKQGLLGLLQDIIIL